MLPKVLSEQLETVIRSYRHPSTGEPLSHGTKKNWRFNLLWFYTALAERQPDRKIENLSDFQLQDLKDYKGVLENRAIKPITVASHLVVLKGIFRAAHTQEMTPTNISEGLKSLRPTADDQYRRIPADEIKRLCAIDEKRLAKMDMRERYLYLRDITMIAVHKDAALRASEVIRLCEEDILWSRETPGGHIPIIIRESKGRAPGYEDTTYLSPWGRGYLKRFLQVRTDFLRETGATPGQVQGPKSEKPLGTALFLARNGNAIQSTAIYESKIFPRRLREAGLSPNYTSHYLRHTRITELVESGMDPKRVQKLARHKEVTTTLGYYHFNQKELEADLDKRFGLTSAPKPESSPLIPQQPVRLEIARHALKSVGIEPDTATLEGIDATFQAGMKPEASQDLYYSVHQACTRLRIKRTQLYVARIRPGYLHPLKIGTRTVFLKSEVDTLASYRTTEEASAILGYKEKVPVTTARLAAQGIIPALKIGKGWLFRDQDLADYLLDKNGGRVRLALKRALHGTAMPQPISHATPLQGI